MYYITCNFICEKLPAVHSARLLQWLSHILIYFDQPMSFFVIFEVDFRAPQIHTSKSESGNLQRSTLFFFLLVRHWFLIQLEGILQQHIINSVFDIFKSLFGLPVIASYYKFYYTHFYYIHINQSHAIQCTIYDSIVRCCAISWYETGRYSPVTCYLNRLYWRNYSYRIGIMCILRERYVNYIHRSGWGNQMGRSSIFLCINSKKMFSIVKDVDG